MFREVDRIRLQLETADVSLRPNLADELSSLRRLGDKYMHNWMSLDEQIHDLIEIFQLTLNSIEVGDAQLPEVTSTSTPTQDLFSVPDKAIIEQKTNRSNVLTHSPVVMPSAFEVHDGLEGLLYDSPQAQFEFRRGLGYFDLLMFPQCAKSMEDVLNRQEVPVARVYLAAARAAEGRFTEAIRHVTRLRLTTDEVVLLCAANEIEANICVVQKQYQQASRLLFEVTCQMDTYQDVWFNLGICYAKQGDWASSIHSFEKALKLDSDDVEIYHALCYVLLTKGRYAEAITICSSGLEKFTNHLGLLGCQCVLLRKTGRFENCESICKRIISLHPKDPLGWTQYCALQLQLKDYARAITIAKQFISLKLDDALIQTQLGVAYLFQGEDEVAERILLHTVMRHINKSLIWIALGRMSSRRGDTAQAYTRMLRAMRDEHPQIRRLALYSYGSVLLEHKQYAQAEQYLKAAANLGAPNPAIFAALGESSQRQGRPLEAQQWFSKAQKSGNNQIS